MADQPLQTPIGHRGRRAATLLLSVLLCGAAGARGGADQVVIEARVAEVSGAYLKSLGVQFDTALPSLDPPTAIGGVVAVVGPDSDVPRDIRGTLNARVQGEQLDFIRQAVELRTSTSLSDAPGSDLGASSDTRVRIRNGNLIVLVTPVLADDAGIVLNLSRTSLGNVPPAGGPRLTQAELRVPNGGTLLVSGLELEAHPELETKVPVLADLPVVGDLFRGVERSSLGTRLLIVVTPRLVRGEDAGPAPGAAADQDVDASGNPINDSGGGD